MERIERNTRDMANDAANCNRGAARWIPGAILIALGTVFLLDHLNVINAEVIWKYWPLLLIALGIAKAVNEGKRVGGIMLALVGLFFMLEHLGYRLFTWNNFWPVLIIAAGIAMIWGRFDVHYPKHIRAEAGASGEPGAGNTIQAFAIFGGVERRVHLRNFAGGELTAMFGGIEIDFRSADIDGAEAVIFVEAVFGGIELVIPDGWNVVWEGQNIFGGYSDETRPPLPDVPGAAPRKRLILRGRALFGGVSIKN
jgi:predicted membrane protein